MNVSEDDLARLMERTEQRIKAACELVKPKDMSSRATFDEELQAALDDLKQGVLRLVHEAQGTAPTSAA